MVPPLTEDVGLERLAQALEDNCAALFRQFAETLDGDFVETQKADATLRFPITARSKVRGARA